MMDKKATVKNYIEKIARKNILEVVYNAGRRAAKESDPRTWQGSQKQLDNLEKGLGNKDIKPIFRKGLEDQIKWGGGLPYMSRKAQDKFTGGMYRRLPSERI